jgi:tol-pal system protein YbgF
MAFNDFLRQFPNDELAPKAHYYLGQILEQDGDLDGAVEEYASIRELFPADPQVPQALYRIALIRIQQGDEDEARKMLETVINTYPDDLVTDMARNKLREIGGSDR